MHIEGTSEQVEAAKQLVNEVTSEVCMVVDVSLWGWLLGTPTFCCIGTLNFWETVQYACPLCFFLLPFCLGLVIWLCLCD